MTARHSPNVLAAPSAPNRSLIDSDYADLRSSTQGSASDVRRSAAKAQWRGMNAIAPGVDPLGQLRRSDDQSGPSAARAQWTRHRGDGPRNSRRCLLLALRHRADARGDLRTHRATPDQAAQPTQAWDGHRGTHYRLCRCRLRSGSHRGAPLRRCRLELVESTSRRPGLRRSVAPADPRLERCTQPRREFGRGRRPGPGSACS